MPLGKKKNYGTGGIFCYLAALSCGPIDSCQCRDGNWACMSSDMMECADGTPADHPFGKPCDPEHELPSPPARYQQLSYGSASCPAGTDIVSEPECFQAIEDLGITGLWGPWVGEATDIPRWCSVKDRAHFGGSGKRPHFGGSASGGVGRWDLAPICKLQVALP